MKEINPLFPNSSKAWAPKEDLIVLGIWVPQHLDQVPTPEMYLNLLARRVQWMVDRELAWENPDLVDEALEVLDDHGLVDGIQMYHQASHHPALGLQIMMRDLMRQHLMAHHGLDQVTFPLAPRQDPELVQVLQEIRLAEWANAMTQPMM